MRAPASPGIRMIIDVATRKVVGTVKAGLGPWGVAIAP